jgi:hypothetical protein
MDRQKEGNHGTTERRKSLSLLVLPQPTLLLATMRIPAKIRYVKHLGILGRTANAVMRLELAQKRQALEKGGLTRGFPLHDHCRS